MATLPNLKSGTTAQYPLRRHLIQNVDTIGFVDGSEQRCSTSRLLHQWILELGSIDEQDFAALETFVEQQQGPVGHFSFIDPIDGVEYLNCSLTLCYTPGVFQSPGRVATEVIIRENPN